MRIFLILIPAFLMFTGASGQGSSSRCPYKTLQVTDARFLGTVNDFTITTTDGVTRNLYSTLDSGKTVFIDLYFTTCSWCQYYAPVIEEIYQNTGAGEGQVEFWGISNNLNDTDPVIDQYKANYNITNPCAGPQGGGTTAHTTVISGQNFLGWPTYCVVCPDRTMYFDPVYPPTVTGFNPYFETCAAMVGTGEDAPAGLPGLHIYPNPAGGHLFVDMDLESDAPAEISLVNIIGTKMLSLNLDMRKGRQTISVPVGELPPGMYVVQVRQANVLTGFGKVTISRY